MATTAETRGIRDPQHETMPREELRKLQGDRLAKLVARIYENVPFYRNLLTEAGITPEKVTGLEQLGSLPFTYKRDLRDQYPFGLFAVPLKQIVRIHASSGTTGKPTTVGYTRGDIDMWSECMARTMAAAGVTDEDIVQNAYGYGLFTGGLGAHYGAERLGAAVIPISGGNTQKQLMLMQDYSSTVLCSTPSFALYIWDVANELGIDMRTLPLRVGVFGAEPWSEAMRKDIEEKLNIKAVDIYGLSEIMGPGVSFECADVQQGLHVNEDFFLAEIIDPDTGDQLPDGELGELVFTTLTKEGIPLLRYRTGDITRLNVETCACGRTFARMDRVSGRSDDMLIIRGVNVFPSQVESVLLLSPEIEPHYRLIVDRQGSMDTLAVEVEVNPSLYKEAKDAILSADDAVVLAEYESLKAVKKTIKENVKDIIGVTIDVVLKEPGAIERSEGKAKRVVDKRPK
jgi:phenylacetate-CoA ligase